MPNSRRAAQRISRFPPQARGPVRSRADSDAPPTDRAVAYAIEDTDAGPLVSSKLIAGIALAAAIATTAVLMRTPNLEASAQDETAAEERTWWTAAREQWANESMRVWPIVIRNGSIGRQDRRVRQSAGSRRSEHRVGVGWCGDAESHGPARAARDAQRPRKSVGQSLRRFAGTARAQTRRRGHRQSLLTPGCGQRMNREIVAIGIGAPMYEPLPCDSVGVVRGLSFRPDLRAFTGSC